MNPLMQAKVIGDKLLIQATAGRAATIGKEQARLVRHWGMLLNTRIKAHASGRPGPNAPTGDYRRSWTMTFQANDEGAVAVNGTNRDQGRRLEFGFVGVDSLGRAYDQPPYPHAGPALQEIEPKFLAAHKALLRTIK
jgi:hypothetical protein